MPIKTTSAARFARDVLGCSLPVVVEFFAGGATTPELDAVATQLVGRATFVGVDVDRNHSLRQEYQIRALPALILFKNGRLVSRRIGGAIQKAEIEEWINSALILALATRRTSAARSRSTFTLQNGMDAIVIPDHRAHVVTHMVWYRVGSADEPKGLSGIARFLEHMTFKSLHKTPAGAFEMTIRPFGGESNAFSGREATAYYQRIAPDQLQLAMEVEAERMVRLDLTEDDVATERQVLMEHRRSSIDSDLMARLREKMRAALYRSHPHGLPVVGLAHDIARLTREDLYRFHRRYYWPNNAILVVSGDVTVEEVKRLSHQIYGKLPSNPIANKKDRARPPTQIAPRRVALDDSYATTASFCRIYAVPGYGMAKHGEAEALEVLTNIVGGGMTSRLYRKLVIDEKIAATISATYDGNVVDEGAIMLSARATDPDLSAVESSVEEVMDDVRKRGVTQSELASAKTALLARQIFDDDDQFTLACRYGSGVTIGRRLDDIEDWPVAISKVTADDVRRAAAYLIPRRSVTGLLEERVKVRRLGV